MEGEGRREEILRFIQEAEGPVSGARLAEKFGVSRQVIVQDIALLRASNKNILATNKGYLLFRTAAGEEKAKRTFKVKHTEEQIQDELNTVVDLGGKVLDVVVEHAVYGQIMVDLIISSRLDVENFVEKIRKNGTKPLNELTNGVHYHTVEADSQEILGRIEQELSRRGYLIN